METLPALISSLFTVKPRPDDSVDDNLIFISYNKKDSEIAKQVAEGIEKEGYKAWYFERDSIPGPSYLKQESEIIPKSIAIILIISENSLNSVDVTRELECVHRNRIPIPIVPILSSIEWDEVEKNNIWKMILGTAAAISIPPEGVSSIIPKIIKGLKALDVQSSFPVNKKETEEGKKPEKKIKSTQDDIPNFITGKDGAKMVLIPAGDFEMGTDPSEIPEIVQWAKKCYPKVQASKYEDETPRHTVYVDAFYMDIYEVTNAQYKKFMDATGHKHWDDSGFNAPNQPVVGVSWNNANDYASWAGKRLPTEAEWEKAARGGLVGKRFPWGDEDPDGTQCNFADKNTDYQWSDKNVDDGYQYTASIGSYHPNGYGLYDMAGNVWEWCADLYDKDYYAVSPRKNPQGLNLGNTRVLRGGSWYGNSFGLRVAFRRPDNPSLMGNPIGFRCVGLLK